MNNKISNFPSPDHIQHIQFEGCDSIVLAPEEYESLYNRATQLWELLDAHRELRRIYEYAFDKSGPFLACHGWDYPEELKIRGNKARKKIDELEKAELN